MVNGKCSFLSTGEDLTDGKLGLFVRNFVSPVKKLKLTLIVVDLAILCNSSKLAGFKLYCCSSLRRKSFICLRSMIMGCNMKSSGEFCGCPCMLVSLQSLRYVIYWRKVNPFLSIFSGGSPKNFEMPASSYLCLQAWIYELVALSNGLRTTLYHFLSVAIAFWNAFVS